MIQASGKLNCSAVNLHTTQQARQNPLVCEDEAVGCRVNAGNSSEPPAHGARTPRVCSGGAGRPGALVDLLTLPLGAVGPSPKYQTPFEETPDCCRGAAWIQSLDSSLSAQGGRKKPAFKVLCASSGLISPPVSHESVLWRQVLHFCLPSRKEGRELRFHSSNYNGLI